jgi:RNA recognition motif-containing protein
MGASVVVLTSTFDANDRYVKGYALVEYATRKEAENAIESMNGQELLTQTISVTWAFQQGPIKRVGGGRGVTNGGGRRR